MTISVIVAVSDNGVIGQDGKIPWRLSTDLARFKRITTDNCQYVVMGSNTYKSLPRHLKGRDTIVITKQPKISFTHDQDFGTTSFMPLEWINELFRSRKSTHFMVIGGQQIYDEIFKKQELIHRVYLTRVHCNVEGDTFFKHIFSNPMSDNFLPNTRDVWWENEDGSMVKWKMTDQQFIPKSDKDEYDSTFQVWENRS